MATLTADALSPPPADPTRCEEFGYGLGPPDGILLVRYAMAGRLDIGRVRDDLLHHLYWAPEATTSAAAPGVFAYAAPDEAFWARAGVSHRMRVHGCGSVVRVSLREVPPALEGLDAGVVGMTSDAAEAVARLTGPARWRADWRAERSRLLSGLVAAPEMRRRPGAAAAGRGYALTVASALVHDPADPTPMAAWAARVHCSPKTLQRDFEATLRMSFTRWRTRQRLALARALVPTTPVGARLVGYASTSAFVAAYTREFGVTPGRHARWASAAAQGVGGEGVSIAPPKRRSRDR